MFSLRGKSAVVTGGASGIGRAVAARFEEAGARVTVIDRVPSEEVHTIRADVSDEAGLAAALAKAAAHHGRIDILVNNAAIQPLGPTFAETTPELLEHTFRVNVHSVLFGLKHGPRHMKGGGRVINTASFIGIQAAPKVSAYGLSKASIVYLTKVAAIELAPRRITVNCVCPATVRTPAVTAIANNPEIAWMGRTAPLGRMAEVEEVAAAFHYLASDEAAYVTGHALVLDGGATAGMPTHDVIPPPQVVDGRWVDDLQAAHAGEEVGA